jgi:hypothetical protein
LARRSKPDFSVLMTGHDLAGDWRATFSGHREENFRFMKESGFPQRLVRFCRQLRRPEGHPFQFGHYLKEKGGRTVSAVLLRPNVRASTLRQDGIWNNDFARTSTQRCPLDDSSTFFGPFAARGLCGAGFGLSPKFGQHP